MCDTTLSTQEKPSKLFNEHRFATFISGCHVKWATTNVLNKGYIVEAGTTMVASWDSSVERRAGGYDSGAAPIVQEFTLSNMSAMMALLMEVVYHFKHKSLSSQMISALNAAENVSQSKLKTHSELDNIKMVSSWMNSMQQYTKLSKDVALDVFKYVIVVRDRRIHLPD